MSEKIFDDGCGCVAARGTLCGKCVTRLYVDWKELERSRNELLELIDQIVNGGLLLWGDTLEEINQVIQKVKALKEKEE